MHNLNGKTIENCKVVLAFLFCLENKTKVQNDGILNFCNKDNFISCGFGNFGSKWIYEYGIRWLVVTLLGS